MAEWSACWTNSLAVPVSSNALTTTWICLMVVLYIVQTLGHACKQPNGLPTASSWDS